MDQAKTAKKEFEHIFANHSLYYGMAFNNLTIAKSYDDQSKNLQIDKQRGDLDKLVKIMSLSSALNEACIVTIVFSAMAAEAFINFYAINRMSRKQFRRYDKMDLLNKWELFPLMLTGKRLDRRSAAFSRLAKLIKLRNRLVHYKSAKVNVDKSIKELNIKIKSMDDYRNFIMTLLSKKNPAPVTLDDGINAVTAVKLSTEELKKIDDSIDIDWITQPEKHLAEIKKIEGIRKAIWEAIRKALSE